MAREAYRSLYGDLTKLRDTTLLDLSSTADDDELFQLLLAVSGWIDRYCNRHFYSRTQTLEFDGNGEDILVVPDLIAVTTLKADENEDLTFEITWATTDYWLWPYNAEPTQPWGEPYQAIRVRRKGTKTAFLEGEQIYEIAGRWGYSEHKEDSTSLINNASGISATDTTITVDDGADFAIGQTLIIESEQVLVTNISGANLTVVRALNGTTGATHADNTIIYILRWPAAVERAALMTAARIWSRAPAFEPFYVDADLDTDARMMLESYRRLTV